MLEVVVAVVTVRGVLSVVVAVAPVCVRRAPGPTPGVESMCAVYLAPALGVDSMCAVYLAPALRANVSRAACAVQAIVSQSGLCGS